MERSRTIGVDYILESVGSKGRWQVTQYVLLAIHFLSSASVTLSIVFTGYSPSFHCAQPADELASNLTVIAETNECTVHDNSTNTSTSCISGFMFDAHRTDLTIVTEWQLVCGRAFLSELSQTMVYAGLGIGSLFGTPLADKFGRRRVYLVCEIGLFTFTLATAFSPNIAVFIALRAVSGALSVAGNQAASIASMELFPVKHRTFVGTVLAFNWALALVLYSGLAYAIRNLTWRQHQMVLATISVLVTASFYFTDESLRWLLARGRTKDAAKLLKKVVKINKVPLETLRTHIRNSHAEESEELDTLLGAMKIGEQPNENESHELRNDDHQDKNSDSGMDDESGRLNKGEQMTESEVNRDNPKENILTLFRHPKLRFRTLAIGWGWLVNTLTYYGLYLMSGTLNDNRYLEFFLNSIVELPAIILTIFMLKRLGRRVPCIIFLVACASSLLLATILDAIQDSKIPVTVLVILGKFWITCSFALLVVLTSELFPTNIRTSAYGITSGMSRVGGMVAPFLRTLARLVSWAPGVIFFTCCISMAVCAYYLPETSKRELPQSVAEVDSWDRGDSDKNKA